MGDIRQDFSGKRRDPRLPQQMRLTVTAPLEGRRGEVAGSTFFVKMMLEFGLVAARHIRFHCGVIGNTVGSLQAETRQCHSFISICTMPSG
jgi:hypothetical protein